MYVCMYSTYMYSRVGAWVLGKTNHEQVLTTSSRHASGTSPGERHFGWMGEWMDGWILQMAACCLLLIHWIISPPRSNVPALVSSVPTHTCNERLQQRQQIVPPRDGYLSDRCPPQPSTPPLLDLVSSSAPFSSYLIITHHPSAPSIIHHNHHLQAFPKRVNRFFLFSVTFLFYFILLFPFLFFFFYLFSYFPIILAAVCFSIVKNH